MQELENPPGECVQVSMCVSHWVTNKKLAIQYEYEAPKAPGGLTGVEWFYLFRRPEKQRLKYRSVYFYVMGKYSKTYLTTKEQIEKPHRGYWKDIHVNELDNLIFCEYASNTENVLSVCLLTVSELNRCLDTFMRKQMFGVHSK